jgi:hypothetical protein
LVFVINPTSTLFFAGVDSGSADDPLVLLTLWIGKKDIGIIRGDELGSGFEVSVGVVLVVLIAGSSVGEVDIALVDSERVLRRSSRVVTV